MPTLAFTHGWYLLLLLPLLVGTVALQRHSLAGLDAGRARAALVARLLLLLCGVTALAGPTAAFPSRALSVLFLLDRSGSVAPEAQRREVDLVRRATAALPANAEAGVLIFGREPQLETEPSAAGWAGRIHSRVDPDGTDLGAALRLGSAALPEQKQRRLVVLSDGNETSGHAAEEAESLAASGVQVDVVPVAYHYRREALLESLAAPESAHRGEPLEVRVIARSTVSTGATVRLLLDGALVGEKRVVLRPGPLAVTFNETLTRPGFHTWEALLEAPEDTLPENNRALGFTHVAGTPKLLLLEGTPGDGAFLEQVLRGHFLEVDRRGPLGMPSSLAALQGYDSVILDNVRADQLSAAAMRLLQSGVRDLGIGCMMVGGENSLTAGGWHGTPVEELLPVRMEAQRRREEAEVALVLVLDRSGSMAERLGSGVKLQFAQSAAEAAVEALRPDDQVGVVAFDSTPEWVAPLNRRGDGGEARRGIESIGPLGGTSMYPALEEAEAALRHSHASVKHVLLLTDGRSTPGDWDGIAREFARLRITLSTVGVGQDADAALLTRLARRGGGRYYAAAQGEALPAIFDREARLISRAALVEEPFTPVVEPGSPLLRGLPAAPPLLGYVATTAKAAPGVDVSLRSRRGDPVLAAWQYGLGRSAVVTTDARNRWAAPWLAAGDYFSRFWAQVARQTVRPGGESGLRPSVRIEADDGRVTVEARTPTGEFANNLDITGRVAGPDGGQPMRLNQTGPGRYEGRFSAAACGQYLVTLSHGGALSTTGAAVPYSPELRALESNTALLLQIAERTGGQRWPSLGPGIHSGMLPRFFRPAGPGHPAPQELWQLFLLAGVLLLPVDVGLGRVTLSRPELRAALGALLLPVTGRLFPSSSPVPVEAGMGRLRAARERAGTRSATAPAVHDLKPSAPTGSSRPAAGAASRPAAAVEEAVPAVPEPGPIPSSTGRLLAAKRRAASGALRGEDAGGTDPPNP